LYIQATTIYKMIFTPTHNLKNPSKIKITIGNEITIEPTCSITGTDVSGLVCSLAGQVISATTPFGADWTAKQITWDIT